jgi:hypothetical protein
VQDAYASDGSHVGEGTFEADPDGVVCGSQRGWYHAAGAKYPTPRQALEALGLELDLP